MTVFQTAQKENNITVAVDVEQWLLDTAAGIGGEAGEVYVQPLLALFHQANIPATLTLTIPILRLPTREEEPIAIDPVLVLDNIAQAVSQAERDLNQQNMVLAAGLVETFLTTFLGDGNIAHSKISLSILPRSYT